MQSGCSRSEGANQLPDRAGSRSGGDSRRVNPAMLTATEPASVGENPLCQPVGRTAKRAVAPRDYSDITRFSRMRRRRGWHCPAISSAAATASLSDAVAATLGRNFYLTERGVSRSGEGRARGG